MWQSLSNMGASPLFDTLYPYKHQPTLELSLVPCYRQGILVPRRHHETSSLLVLDHLPLPHFSKNERSFPPLPPPPPPAPQFRITRRPFPSQPEPCRPVLAAPQRGPGHPEGASAGLGLEASEVCSVVGWQEAGRLCAEALERALRGEHILGQRRRMEAGAGGCRLGLRAPVVQLL